jgi:aspartyl-tRNA(Asn)/glutamyl-tRNA(Gln) amidotransferase subunit B
MSKWQAVVGLEAHFQLRSLRKAFCACVARDYFKAPPNSLTCGICLGAPGTLPVVRRRPRRAAMMLRECGLSSGGSPRAA